MEMLDLDPQWYLDFRVYTFRKKKKKSCLICWLQLNDSEVRKDSGKSLNQYVKVRIQIKLKFFIIVL